MTTPEKPTSKEPEKKEVFSQPDMPEKDRVETGEKVKTEILMEWSAPVRPFKKRDREFYSTAGAIAFLVIVILFFLKEWFLIVVIIAFFFYVYVISNTPPEKTDHRISNKGIVSAGKNYRWEELGAFWFSEQWGERILNVNTPFQLPGRLMMLLGDKQEEEIKKVLERFLEFEEQKPTVVDKASDWLAKNIPLDKTPPPSKKE